MTVLAICPSATMNSGTEFAHPCRWHFILLVLSCGIFFRLEIAFLTDFMQQCCFWFRTFQAALPSSQISCNVTDALAPSMSSLAILPNNVML